MQSVARDVFYVRLQDRFRVRVIDWPDGDVSWLVDPMPLVGARIVGTCSGEYFERRHKATDQPVQNAFAPKIET